MTHYDVIKVAAKYKPKEELFGIFGRRNQNFDDVLELNIREGKKLLLEMS